MDLGRRRFLISTSKSKSNDNGENEAEKKTTLIAITRDSTSNDFRSKVNLKIAIQGLESRLCFDEDDGRV